MTALNKQDSDLEKLCSVAIEQRLGDISGLPKDLVEHVLNSYRRFIASYLNMKRISMPAK